MQVRNGIPYHGVWELNGKFWKLAESAIPDWECTGQRLEDEYSGYSYEEVKFVPPDPIKAVRVWTLREARVVVKGFLADESIRAIRIVVWGKNDDGSSFIQDTSEIETYKNDGKYKYGYGLDAVVASHIEHEETFSFEGVKFSE